jgi:hypothetical protein
VEAVVERGGEELRGARRERRAEERRAADREGGVREWDLGRERRPGLRRRHGRLRDERDQLRGNLVGDARDPALPGQAHASGQGGREVVGVALELHALGQEGLRVGLTAGDDRSGDEPQCDHRRARAEPPLPRDAVEEVEAEAVGGSDALERPHAEVRPVGLAVAGGDLELVPEVERDGGAVEAGAEVRRRRGRAHVELHSVPGHSK